MFRGPFEQPLARMEIPVKRQTLLLLWEAIFRGYVGTPYHCIRTSAQRSPPAWVIEGQDYG